jgi:N-succinyldiaminopimelate aminotransferase
MRRPMNPIYEAMPVSVFARMSELAARHNAINLGQGFPDFGWPDAVLERAADALLTGSNQYAPSRGLPELRQAIAAHYGRHFGQDYCADNVCVTSGATEALTAAILATISPGDEVIVFTPAYDSYVPTVRRGGGVAVEVALRPPEWRIEEAAIEAAVTPRTRAIILNNPHNPAGRLFGERELQAVAAVAAAHGLTVIADEVWEHVVLSPPSALRAATSPSRGGFIPFASLPGMAERTIKVGSAGKIFSLTGWKVGWLVAPEAMAGVAAKAHQFLTFATAPNLQSAVAYGLSEGDAWIAPMQERFARARDRMTEGLRSAGFAVLPADATYFLCVDLAASGVELDDEAFAATAVERAGVAVVPISPFAEKDPPRHLVRLCFGKRDETIDNGVAAMARARELLA